MNIVDLNKDWLKCVDYNSDSEFNLIPQGEKVNLPYDMLPSSERNFNTFGASLNGYYGSAWAAFYKELPKLNKGVKTVLDIWGVGGVAEVYLNGASVGKITDEGHNLIDLTQNLSEKNIIKIAVNSYSDSGAYTGLGICGGAQLLTAEKDLYIEPYGVYIKTTEIDKKAAVTVSAEIKNDSNELKFFIVKAEVLNRKGKRVVKKLRKVKLKANTKKIFDLKIKMSRHYDWSTYDPYLYGCKLSLIQMNGEEENIFDTSVQTFGVRTFIYTGKMFKLNNLPVKLKGAFAARDNGMLGNASEFSAEMYKLGKIKAMGFNSVRFTGVPTDNALKAADKLGLMCVVDLFSALSQSNFMNDGHLFFDSTYNKKIELGIKAMRNHPSVVIYSACADPSESYGRGQGYEIVGKIVQKIKEFDSVRPVTASAAEKIPTKAEIEKYNIKYSKAEGATAEEKALNAAREKDLFRALTDKYFEKVDFASYSNLHSRFSLDKDRMILGLKADSAQLYEAFEETDKNTNVLGNFIYAGADFIGNESLIFNGAPKNFDKGLLDKTYRYKKEAVYARTVLSKPFTAAIYVQNPAELESGADAEITPDNISPSWNWPQYVGKPVKVRVYSNAEIVALFLDGRQISRKLTGKFNKFYADFKTNYFPGKLEAVGYYKGSEVNRVALETASAPKMLKLECSTKVLKEGELSFVNVVVKDKEGRLITNHNGTVKITVEGAGKLRAFSNGDPYSFESVSQCEQQLYNGAVTAVIEPVEAGKIIVKAVCNGLLSNKTAIRVK